MLLQMTKIGIVVFFIPVAADAREKRMKTTFLSKYFFCPLVRVAATD